MNRIYTVGHSTQSIEEFIHLLKKHYINCLIDVRSVPYSKYATQFDKEELKRQLSIEGIYYIHMGEELGARRDEKDVYLQGMVDFEKVSGCKSFLSGINRVIDGINKNFTIAIMCTEKDPIECHRSILVSRALHNRNFEVLHILSNGEVQSHSKLEDRLLEQYFPNRNQGSIFDLIEGKKTEEELLRESYKLQNEKIGYRVELQKEGNEE